MSHSHTCRVLGLFALAVLAFVHGCQSTSPISAVVSRYGPAGDARPAAPMVLAPGMEVEWHVKGGKESTTIRNGLAVIAPDGKIELGPYGACRIGGMTIPKATTTLEKHLAKYVAHPTVTISSPSVAPTTAAAPTAVPTTAVPTTADLAWRPTDPSKTTVSASWFQAPKEGEPGGGEDKDKGKEQIGAPKVMVMPPPQELLGPACGPGGQGGPGGLPLLSAPSECRPTLLPPYVIGPTDVLLIQSLKGREDQKVAGPHLVGPDGAVRIGIYGSVPLAGLTLDQARATLAQAIHERGRLDPEKITVKDVMDGVSIDVLAYNSKVYYIIIDGAQQQGEQIVSLPVTGNDKVLDAFAKIQGLPVVSSKHRIWVARLTCANGPETILPVDWAGITKRGDGTTNWQLMPGDRIFVAPDPWYVADGTIRKVLAPIERLFGATLLGSQTVNSIKTGSVGGTR